MLTDNEVLSLENVLVRDNESLTHVRRSRASYGAGNTNTSDYSGQSFEYPLSDFEGKPIRISKYAHGFEVVAAVEDVLYILEYSHTSKKVIRLNICQTYSDSHAISYDTYEVYSITPVSHIKNRLQTGLGTYEGNTKGDVPEGKGVYVYDNSPDGMLECSGIFRDGAPCGYCKVKYIDGSTYEGYLSCGVFCDRGEYHYPNGEYYVGYFSEGKMHGSGVLYHADGRVKHNGWWKNGKIVK